MLDNPIQVFSSLCTITLACVKSSYVGNGCEVVSYEYPTTLDFLPLNLLALGAHRLLPKLQFLISARQRWLKTTSLEHRYIHWTKTKQDLFHWKQSVLYFILLKNINVSKQMTKKVRCAQNARQESTIRPRCSFLTPCPLHPHPLLAGKGWRPGTPPQALSASATPFHNPNY